MNHQFYGAVIRAQDIRMDLRIVELLAQTIGDDEVIDTPARILLPRLKAV